MDQRKDEISAYTVNGYAEMTADLEIETKGENYFIHQCELLFL